MTSTPVAGELRVERHQPPSRATVGEWPLEPESAAWAEVLGRVLTAPLRELGVTKARALPVGADPAPQIEVESVYEVTVPIQTGSVPARVYRPTDDAGLPVLLYMHGGGWTVGGPDGTDRLCRQLSQYAQCVVVSLDYPLAPENPFPTAVEACYDALTWVAGGPEELRIDPMRIAVGGDSAGGNLAAALALMARDRGGPTLQAQLLVYPAVDQDTTRTSWTRWAHTPLLDTADVEWFWKLYGAPSDPRDVRAFPGNAESFAELPPTLIVLAEVDPTHDSGMEYGRRLHAAGIDTRVISYGGVFHGFFPRTSLSPSAQNAAERAGEHLRATLHPAPVRAEQPPGQRPSSNGYSTAVHPTKGVSALGRMRVAQRHFVETDSAAVLAREVVQVPLQPELVSRSRGGSRCSRPGQKYRRSACATASTPYRAGCG